MTNEIVQHDPQQPLARAGEHELSVTQVCAHIDKIHEVMKKAMKPNHHYGVIPGTNKPTLLKPGAEILTMMFRLDPQYSAQTERDSTHINIVSTCTLWHIPTGNRIASGMGSCSTRESKYAYRAGGRVCPACGKPAIIKGKKEFGGGWLCYQKKDGCGAKFSDDAPEIIGQNADRIENPDIADMENTVLKMANKRSLIAAVLNATGCSDIFTQDMEDIQANQQARKANAMPPMQRGSDLKAPARHEEPQEDPGDDLNNPPPEGNIELIHIKNIEIKEGKSKKGPWKMWIVTGDDGNRYATFSATIGATIEDRHERNEAIEVTFELDKNQRRQIKSVK